MPTESPTIGAILLAAGASTRLGQPKQLLQWQGQSLLRRAAKAALDAALSPVVVVLGSRAAAMAPELDGLAVTTVVNADWDQGMGSSLRTGLRKLTEIADPDPDAFIVLLCDQPLVTAASLRTLAALHQTEPHPAIVSEYADGVLGPPTLLSSALFPALLALEGAHGARAVLQTLPPESVRRVWFPGGAADIDTAEDWERVSRLGMKNGQKEQTMNKKVIVTGGSGKAGRACVADLLAHGYRVVNVDQAAPRQALCPFLKADLCDFGQALDAVSGVDGKIDGNVWGIVHLAAIPAPGILTNAETFRNNMISTYNIFEAARRMKIENIVWASSETVLGLPFDTPPPYVPLDEDGDPRPESAYSLSKLLGEQMAAQFCRWNPQMKIVGLRFSNVMEPGDYAAFPSFDSDVRRRKWNLWGYIDARDAAQAVRRALEAPLTGADIFIIANADTTMSRPNAELLAEVFPGVPAARAFGPNETLLSIEKARRILGYEPEYNWRGVLASQG